MSNVLQKISGPPGAPEATWWVEETGDPEWVWYRRNHPNYPQWELRHRDAHGNTRYVNMIWPDPDLGIGWRFWTPGAPPGSAAVSWRLTRAWAKAACLKQTKVGQLRGPAGT